MMDTKYNPEICQDCGDYLFNNECQTCKNNKEWNRQFREEKLKKEKMPPCARCGCDLTGQTYHCDNYDGDPPLYCSEYCYGDVKNIRRELTLFIFSAIVWTIFCGFIMYGLVCLIRGSII